MLYVGDDWAEDHHDVAVLDEQGVLLTQRRVPEGVAGITAFAEVIGELLADDDQADTGQVAVCIETGQGPWVTALIAAGYLVYAVDPKRAKRHSEVLSNSRAKSDQADARSLADMVRTRRHQLVVAGGDTPLVRAVKVLARDHQRAVWECTRHSNRLRAALREYFPAVLIICTELDLELKSAPILGLLTKAPTPEQAERLTVRQIMPLLKRRHNQDVKAAKIREILRREQLRADGPVAAAYAASARSSVAFLHVAIEQTKILEGQVDAHFSRHPDAEIYRSVPGIGPVIGPRLLGEYGDDTHRFRSAKARKNATGTSPVTRQSGKSRQVSARYTALNAYLLDAALEFAHAATLHDVDAHAYYQKQRDRGIKHQAALRQLANRLVGILHGCLTHRQLYDSHTAWPNHDIEVAA